MQTLFRRIKEFFHFSRELPDIAKDTPLPKIEADFRYFFTKTVRENIGNPIILILKQLVPDVAAKRMDNMSIFLRILEARTDD